MIVVAIIAILAVIVIPSFIKESKRGRSRSEVDPMFAELSTREEQRKLEAGSYMNSAACPASASSTGTDMTTAACATGTDWTALRVQAPQSTLTCSYVVRVGAAGTNPNTDGSWPAWVTALSAAPGVSWYFINADCPDTDYFVASWDTKIKAEDGH